VVVVGLGGKVVVVGLSGKVVVVVGAGVLWKWRWRWASREASVASSTDTLAISAPLGTAEEDLM
jgi:hypothetical protein